MSLQDNLKALLENIKLNKKGLLGTSTLNLFWFYVSDEEKSFISLATGVNLIKYFLFVIEEKILSYSVCPWQDFLA
jgi:hypothetical protein